METVIYDFVQFERIVQTWVIHQDIFQQWIIVLLRIRINGILIFIGSAVVFLPFIDGFDWSTTICCPCVWSCACRCRVTFVIVNDLVFVEHSSPFVCGEVEVFVGRIIVDVFVIASDVLSS